MLQVSFRIHLEKMNWLHNKTCSKKMLRHMGLGISYVDAL
jgi:hypothetical protein